MAYISIVPVAPIRAEPSHKSEMTSQLLFGELCGVLGSNADFYLVKCRYDGYEGWCQRSQLTDYGADEYLGKTGYVSEFSSEVLINGQSCIIPFAAVAEQRESPELKINNWSVVHLSQAAFQPSKQDDKQALIRAYAFRYFGAAYLWGGKSIWGTDCSGFVQQVMKMVNIRLPRDSWQQAELGTPIDFLQEANTGDLAFFDNEEGRIVHVGLMLNNNEIIHSSGYVHVDQVDSAGIIHHVTGARTHKLRIVKRFF